MAGTNRAGSIRFDGAERQRPHLAAGALAAIHEQSATGADTSVASLTAEPGQLTTVEDAGPVLIGDAEEIPDVLTVEHQLQRALMNLPDVTFSSLSVQWIDDGVCLEGILEYDGSVPDVCELARQVTGVENVLNRVVIRPVGSSESQRPDH
jgi:hypothetical protein